MTLKFLLLGASHSDFYLANAIKEFGYELYTSGNYADGLTNCIADKYIPADYSDFQSCLNAIKGVDFDFILPSANDFSYLTTCKINDYISSMSYLDNHEISLIIHRKDLFRSLCKQLSLSSPKLYAILSDRRAYPDNIKFPCVIKPVDLTGGKGVYIAKNTSDLQNYLLNYLRILI
mgnify:CR=1 FL=1